MSSTSSSSEPPAPATRPPLIDVDANRVARALGLAPDAFRKLMEHGHIRTLSERGIGEDAGRYRLSFYWRERRFRIVTDADGRLLAADERALPSPPRQGHHPR